MNITMHFTPAFTQISVRLALLALGAISGAHAETAVERQIRTGVAPHVKLASADPATAVKVHYVHLVSDFSLGTPFADNIKHYVNTCLEADRLQGKQSNPPKLLPKRIDHHHRYTYYARNRSITYTREYYSRIEPDCSLTEKELWRAELRSAKGDCKIDLIERTAKGVCDADAHAGAPVPPQPPSQAEMDAKLAQMAANPATAALAAKIRATTPQGAVLNHGIRKMAGYPCESTGLPGSQSCLSTAGSFRPAVQTGALGGVMLQHTSPQTSITAVEAQFDMAVNGAVFKPYLGGGYTITGRR